MRYIIAAALIALCNYAFSQGNLINKDMNYIKEFCAFAKYELKDYSDTSLNYVAPNNDAHVFTFDNNNQCKRQVIVTYAKHANEMVKYFNENFVQISDKAWRDYSTNTLHMIALSKDNEFLIIYITRFQKQ